MNACIIQLAIFIFGLTFLSCKDQIPTQEIYVMLDQTETYFNHLSIDQIRNISVLKNNINQGEIIHIQGITELSRTDIARISIQSFNPLLGNEIERKNHVDQYFSRIDSVLNLMQARRAQRDGSSILIPLFDNLNALSESIAQSRKLIINSDLYENMLNIDPDYNLYELIQLDKDKTSSEFLNRIPLKDLKGIEIIILYLPTDKLDDSKFEMLSVFYKSMLESRGAKVKITGSI